VYCNVGGRKSAAVNFKKITNKEFVLMMWTTKCFRVRRLAPVIAALLAVLLSVSSCVSTRSRMMSGHEMSGVNVLGTVEDAFTSFQLFYVVGNKSVQRKAYTMLRTNARRQYKLDYSEFDIVNIKAEFEFTWWHIPVNIFTSFFIWGDVQRIAVRGDVVCKSGKCGAVAPKMEAAKPAYAEVNAVRPPEMAQRLEIALSMSKKFEDAVVKAGNALMDKLPDSYKRIAVVDLTSDDSKIASYLNDEVMDMIENIGGFTIVDREEIELIKRLNAIKEDGTIDKDAKKKLKGAIGAQVIITGKAVANRLYLRAVDAETGALLCAEKGSY